MVVIVDKKEEDKPCSLKYLDGISAGSTENDSKHINESYTK